MPKSNYRRGRRRRMEKFALGEISFVDSPAQSPAVADIMKNHVGEMTVEELMDPNLSDEEWLEKHGIDSEGEVEKNGDLVDMVTSVDEGHQHGIRVRDDCDGMYLWISYAGGDRDSMHDHQVIFNADGTYSVTENVGHSHTIDSVALQQVIIARIAAKAADLDDDKDREARKAAADAGEAMPDGSFPVFGKDHLSAALIALEAAPEDAQPEIAAHVIKRADALGLGEEMPKDGSLAAILAKASTGGGSVGKGEIDMPVTQEELDALKAKNERLEKVAALSGVHKSHFDTLDEATQDEFLKADEAGRDALVEAAEVAKADEDPVVYTADNGDEFRKSDDPRLIKMAKDRDEERKENALLKAKTEDDALAKRAETDLANFPGDVPVRKAILKAVDGIEDDETRTAALDALKAKDARMAKGFTTIGTTGTVDLEKALGDKESAGAELDELAKARASKEGEDFYTAYEKVAQENPELAAKAVG